MLGSRGSVIPTFVRQIEAGGPVTVTDARMTRFFMSIPEAVQLVLQAAAMSGGGEIFMLEMGEPVRIIELAKRMVRLSGYRLGADIEIRVTGMPSRREARGGAPYRRRDARRPPSTRRSSRCAATDAVDAFDPDAGRGSGRVPRCAATGRRGPRSDLFDLAAESEGRPAGALDLRQRAGTITQTENEWIRSTT